MGKLKWILYLAAILLIAIPTLIVLISDATFSSTFSHTIISVAIIFVILGKMITVLEKRKKHQSVAPDIGIIIGLFIVFIIDLLN